MPKEPMHVLYERLLPSERSCAMRLARVRFRNFRCYQQETAFDIDDLTLFAGRNDAGKSAIFDALNIFFEEAKIDADDGGR